MILYKIKFKTLTSLFVILIFMTTNAYSGSDSGDQNIIDQSHPRARLIIGSKQLAKKIKLVKARVAPIGNFMRGQAAIQNSTDQRFTLEYKIDWFDDEGFLVGDGGIWERFALGPREIRPFKSLGKSKYAARMQFTVRFPGDTFIESSSHWKDSE